MLILYTQYGIVNKFPMQKASDILKKFNPQEDKYISREFQSFGIHLAEVLGDYKHKALYIKLSKEVPRALLEKALSFAKDANARNKAALFMWKLKEIRKIEKKSTKNTSSQQTNEEKNSPKIH